MGPGRRGGAPPGVSPADPTPTPAIVLIHSFNGLEPGYIALSDRLAEEGYVVLALGWQAHERQPRDATVEQLVRDAVAFLRARSDVDPDRLGLTGFCAGGRYTILLLPLIKEFKAGIAWYGFPYTGGTPVQPTRPADLIEGLSAPILVSHSTEDRPSPIEGISRYTQALAAAGKSFKLKVYEGEPHGFMLQGGQLAQTANARDAYAAMVDFFNRTLKST